MVSQIICTSIASMLSMLLPEKEVVVVVWERGAGRGREGGREGGRKGEGGVERERGEESRSGPCGRTLRRSATRAQRTRGRRCPPGRQRDRER